MASKNLRQLGQLSLCALISAPLVLGSYALLNEFFDKRFIIPLFGMGGCLVFWSFVVGICFQLPKRLPLKQTLLEGVGLGLLAAGVNFILLVGAMFVWVAFFFVS